MLNRSQGGCAVPATVVLALFATALGAPGLANAAGNANQFGVQSRADAAAEMIVLGVQQGISSLPPTSGQSFTYEFDPTLGTYTASGRLGPTSFRSPQTVGSGKFSFRLATSYFDLTKTNQPIPYLVNNAAGTSVGVAAIGQQVEAQVGLINLSANYGFTNRFEMMVNLPIAIVDAQGSEIFTTTQLTGANPPLQGPGVVTDPLTGKVDVDATVGRLNQVIADGSLPFREEPYTAVGADFNQGTNVGVGRISVAAKAVLYADRRVQVAAMPEFFFPSPNQDEFSGSDSAAILPRLVTAFDITDVLKLHVDAGYDYDFDRDELRRFVWNFGPSLALQWATFDAGVGGSKFNRGVQWTPSTASFTDPQGNAGTLQALGDTRLGSNFIDALAGIKVRLNDRSVISGAVNVPLNNEGFRAAAVGTLALELYF